MRSRKWIQKRNRHKHCTKLWILFIFLRDFIRAKVCDSGIPAKQMFTKATRNTWVLGKIDLVACLDDFKGFFVCFNFVLEWWEI